MAGASYAQEGRDAIQRSLDKAHAEEIADAVFGGYYAYTTDTGVTFAQARLVCSNESFGGE